LAWCGWMRTPTTNVPSGCLRMKNGPRWSRNGLVRNSGSKPGGLNKGAYRTLFLSVNKAPNQAAIEKFDAETYMMGVYIHTIKNWQVSRVKEASGSRPWTHIWEQEYEDISGLHGAYMLHPHHWGHIDRWYDPECTDFMIDTFLCHTFCNFDGSVIAPKG